MGLGLSCALRLVLPCGIRAAVRMGLGRKLDPGLTPGLPSLRGGGSLLPGVTGRRRRRLLLLRPPHPGIRLQRLQPFLQGRTRARGSVRRGVRNLRGGSPLPGVLGRGPSMLLRPPAVTLRLQRLQPFFQGGACASVPGGVRVTARRDVPLFRHGGRGRGGHGGALLPGVPGIIGHGVSMLRPPNRLGRLRLLLGRELRLQRLQPFLQGGFRLRGSARGGVFLPCRRRGVPPFHDRRSLLPGVFTPGLFAPRPVRFVPRLQAFHQGGAARAPPAAAGPALPLPGVPAPCACRDCSARIPSPARPRLPAGTPDRPRWPAPRP